MSRIFVIKNYQNLTIGFQVTVENVRDAFLGPSEFVLPHYENNGNKQIKGQTKQSKLTTKCRNLMTLTVFS